jgi:hypothetical protein
MMKARLAEDLGVQGLVDRQQLRAFAEHDKNARYFHPAHEVEQEIKRGYVRMLRVIHADRHRVVLSKIDEQAAQLLERPRRGVGNRVRFAVVQPRDEGRIVQQPGRAPRDDGGESPAAE